MAEDIRHITSDADPRRCQSNSMHGQCRLVSLEGKQYCLMHSGGDSALNIEKEKIRNYVLTQWKVRVGQFADNDQLKSLREEIGILRMTIEAILNKCQDANDLLIHSSKLADLITRVEKMVTSCHRLESATGNMIDKTAAMTLAGQIVKVIGDHIEDAEVLERVSNDILALFNKG